MTDLVPLEPVDYLVIGHITEDRTPAGLRVGGTAAFAALTARVLGLRVGIVTSVAEDTSLAALHGIPMLRVPSPSTTTFENTAAPRGRQQVLLARAESISLQGLPDAWRRAAIVHLAPVAQELGADIAEPFSASLLGITPQGWMRTWDSTGRVSPCKWESSEALLPKAGAVIFSREDIGGDELAIETMSHQTRLLVVTEGAAGCVLYWNGDRRRFRAPKVGEVDDVGAGDVFAAAFFVRLHATRDPWEAARYATLLAARSVTRTGLQSVPTPEEIEASAVEVVE
jgi:sugar/nucleoside kinase (ribokinase family)